MPAKDYIPSKEGDIVPWTENFVQVASANAAALGLGTADITALKTKNADYATKLNIAIAKQAESKAATEAKNIQKDSVIDSIRALARQVQAKPGVPDSLKSQLGLNIPDSSPASVHPSQPKDLSAEIGLGGLCHLKWNRNSNPQGTIFLVESSISIDSEWKIIGTTSKATYDTQLPSAKGHNYFRIKAQRGDLVSEPSSVTVV